MYPREWKEQVLNVWWNADRWELCDTHGVLAGAGGGGDGWWEWLPHHGICLGWTLSGLFFAPQWYKSMLQTKPGFILYSLLTRQLLIVFLLLKFLFVNPRNAVGLQGTGYHRKGRDKLGASSCSCAGWKGHLPPTMGAVPRFLPVQGCIVPRCHNSPPLSHKEVLCQYPSVPEVCAAPSLHGSG